MISTSPSASSSGTIVRDESGVPIGTIVGAVIGAVGGIAILCTLTHMYKRQQSKKRRVTLPTPYEKPELHRTTAAVKRVELAGDDTYPYLARNVELQGNGCNSMSELHIITSHWFRQRLKHMSV
jgi:hypothetical protein